MSDSSKWYFRARVFCVGTLGFDFESFDDLSPKEINIKVGMYAKRKIEQNYWELQKLCMQINVHLTKKNRITPKKIITASIEEKQKQKQIEELTPEEKAEMYKGMISRSSTDKEFLDKKKAMAVIKKLRDQGKLI